MRQPAAALYDIRHLLQAQLPHLPGRLRAVLALWVQGQLLGLNGCQDAVTLALAQGLTGLRNPHTLRRRPRELLYDDADRIDSWGPDQELEVEGCCAPRLQWVRRGWVPTDGRELAQEPRVLAVDPRPEGPRKQDDLVALVISGVYRQHAHPGGPRVAWHIVRAQEKEPWIDHFCRLLRQLAPAPCRPRCRCMGSVTRAGQSGLVGADCGLRGPSGWASLPALPAPRHLSARGSDPTRARALVDHGAGRPVGGHRAGFP